MNIPVNFLDEGDLGFLVNVDKIVHILEEDVMTPNMHGAPYKVVFDKYTHKSLSRHEIQKALNIARKKDFVLYPINTNSGFSVGFRIANVRTREAVMTFKESQLPRGYDFRKLSQTFMQPENVKKANSMNIFISSDRGKYEY
jgi:hypothetical protein